VNGDLDTAIDRITLENDSDSGRIPMTPRLPILTQRIPPRFSESFCRPIDIPLHQFQLPSRKVASGRPIVSSGL